MFTNKLLCSACFVCLIAIPVRSFASEAGRYVSVRYGDECNILKVDFDKCKNSRYGEVIVRYNCMDSELKWDKDRRYIKAGRWYDRDELINMKSKWSKSRMAANVDFVIAIGMLKCWQGN